MSIGDRIEDAVEYFLDHPNKIEYFLNSVLVTQDQVELYIFKKVKEILMEEVTF